MIPIRGSRNRRRREEALIAGFEAAQSTDPTRAKSLLEMGLSEDDQFHQLAEAGLFREISPGRWYLDPDAAADYRDERRRRVFIALAIALLGAALAGWLAYQQH